MIAQVLVVFWTKNRVKRSACGNSTTITAFAEGCRPFDQTEMLPWCSCSSGLTMKFPTETDASSP